MENKLGKTIADRRKMLGLTQQDIADKLCVSSQSVSKWENGTANPDVAYLPQLAAVLRTSVDFLLGYTGGPVSSYEEKYRKEAYYWGLNPSFMCYDLMRLRPPTQSLRILELACGEGKDAVFLARNGYQVTAFDISEAGLEKARRLADANRVSVNFFKADIREYLPDRDFDIVYSSGALYYITEDETKARLFESLKAHTADGGLHVLNTFVKKPFIVIPPEKQNSDSSHLGWKSGELFTHYHDWYFHKMEEVVFNCMSGGIPHRHCMDVMIAEKMQRSLQ